MPEWKPCGCREKARRRQVSSLSLSLSFSFFPFLAFLFLILMQKKYQTEVSDQVNLVLKVTLARSIWFGIDNFFCLAIVFTCKAFTYFDKNQLFV